MGLGAEPGWSGLISQWDMGTEGELTYRCKGLWALYTSGYITYESLQGQAVTQTNTKEN